MKEILKNDFFALATYYPLNFKQMVKEHLFVPLFETFIKETANGNAVN